MAKVLLSLEISVKSASSKDNINKLNSNNIPFEEYEGEIYLINKNVFDSGVNLGSREYDKPYAKFCMRLADTTDSSIYMGEGSLDEEVLAVLYEVFGDTLEFQLTLSCNSDWESISACIKFNEEEDKYYCDTEVTESSEEEDEEDEEDGEDEEDKTAIGAVYQSSEHLTFLRRMADTYEITGAWSMNREELESAWATRNERMDSEMKNPGGAYPRVPRLTDWTILVIENVNFFKLDDARS